MGSKKRITMLVVMAILLVVASGCLGIACSCPNGDETNGGNGEGETQRIVFESLRDAPSSPEDPNYQDFLECYLKYLELYTMNVDGSDVQRITDDDYSESQADISPDGTKILCTIHYDPEGVLEGLEPGWEIAVMDIDGSNLTNLTNNDYLDTGAHWNHDGTKIVYVSDTAHRTADEVVPGDSYVPIQMDVYTMNADGSGKTQLTSAEPGGGYGDPSFSFSEPSKILYNHDEDPLPPHSPDLYMMDADGENKKLILQHEDVDPQATAINDPMFSPDGSTVIFEAKMGDDGGGHVVYNIFTVDISGENLERITQDDGVSEGMPQFSPDGTKLTFDRITRTGDTGGTRHIWVANADRSDEECLSSFHYEGGASWFPVVEDG